MMHPQRTHPTGTTGRVKLMVMAPVGTLFAIPNVLWKSALVRKMENDWGSPATAVHEIVAGPAEVRFDGTVMVSAETSGSAQVNATLAGRKEKNVSETEPHRRSDTSRKPSKVCAHLRSLESIMAN